MRNRLGAVFLSFAMMAGVPAVTAATSVVTATAAVADDHGGQGGCHTDTYYGGYETRYSWHQYGSEWWLYEEHRDYWANDVWCDGVYQYTYYTYSSWYGWDWHGPY